MSPKKRDSRKPSTQVLMHGERGGNRPETAAVWLRVAEQLERDIAGGRFRQTGRLPAETLLAGELGVNRHTLRRAIAVLVRKGALRSVPHIGTFLAPMRIALSLGATSRFSDTLEQAGLTPGGRLLSQQKCPPPAAIAAQLEVARRSQVFELTHLRTANDLPLSYVTSWVPADRFPRIVEHFAASGSLRRALSMLGVASYRRKSVRVSSRHASAEETTCLGLDAGAIVIEVESVNVDTGGEPTHVSLYRFGADRVELIVEP